MIQREPKIMMMGKEIDPSELPDAEMVSLEDAFAPVKLTPRASTCASQIVPEKHWMPEGLYSWLDRRANEAFKKMPISNKEFTQGKLRYTFDYTDKGPQLKMVTLVNSLP